MSSNGWKFNENSLFQFVLNKKFRLSNSFSKPDVILESSTWQISKEFLDFDGRKIYMTGGIYIVHQIFHI